MFVMEAGLINDAGSLIRQKMRIAVKYKCCDATVLNRVSKSVTQKLLNSFSDHKAYFLCDGKFILCTIN